MVKLDIYKHYQVNNDNVYDVLLPNISLCSNVGKNRTSVSYGAFDTETSNEFDKEGKPVFTWVNSWQFAINNRGLVYSYHGRDIRTFVTLLKRISELDYGKKLTMRVWVHNLSFDLEHIYQDIRNELKTDIFVTDNHKYLYMTVKGITNIQFMDSFQLMPKSLGKLCIDYDVFHKKQDNYDYKQQIFSDTPLTEEQIKYDMFDVYALLEIIKGYMDAHPNHRYIHTIPYTQTGEVRELMKQKFLMNEQQNRFTMLNLKPSVEEYKMLLKSFMGGICHCNTNYANKVVYVPDGEIAHLDIKSSYPSSIIRGKYPTKHGIFINPSNVTKELLNEGLYVVTIGFKNLKAKHGFPNLSIHKGTDVKNDAICDNGKIVSCSQFITTISSVDYLITNKCYTFDSITIFNFLYYPSVGACPSWIRQTVIDLFSVKENTPKGIDYMIAKQHINGVYGVCVTNVQRDTLTLLDNCCKLSVEPMTDEELAKVIDKDYNQKYFPYNPWVSAYSRLWLYEGMEKVGFDNVLYTDTDSLFIKCDTKDDYNDLYKKINNLNESIKENSVTVKGLKGYSTLGIWDSEDKNIKKFCAIHSKAYCFSYGEDVDNDVISEMTLCGVVAKNKVSGVTREQEVKTYDNFCTMNDGGKGFIFKECGGTTCIHLVDTPHAELIKGHLQWVGSGGVIVDVNKQISFNELENEIAKDLLMKQSVLNKDNINDVELTYI